MALTVEELQIKLGCDATTAKSALEAFDKLLAGYVSKFENYFKGMGGGSKGDLSNGLVSRFETAAKGIEKQTKAITKQTDDWKTKYQKTFGETFDESMSKMYKNTGEYVPSGKKYIESDSWDRYERSQTRSQNVPDLGFGNQSGPFADIQARLNAFKGDAKQAIESVKAEFNAFGRAIYESTAPSLNALRSTVGPVFQSVKEKASSAFHAIAPVAKSAFGEIGPMAKFAGQAIANGLKFGGKLAISPIKGAIAACSGLVTVGERIKKAFSGTLLGRFTKQLGRTMMRMAAMKLIRGTIDGIKQSLELLGQAGGSAGKAMNSIKAAGQSVKAALGVALMPVVKALAPLFYQLAQMVTAAGNAIARFFATLTGQSSYTAATITKSMDDVSSSVGGAGKAAKGALADFDQLHVLSQNSGGGGGGGADTGLSSVTEQTLEAGNGLADRLRKAFKDGNWQQLGTELGEAINSVFSDKTFSKIGKNIGKKVNALFTTTYWTLKKTNFKNIGSSIASFLNSALSDIDFRKLGGIVGARFTTLPSIIIGFIHKLDFKTLGKSFGDFVRGAVDWATEFVKETDWGALVTDCINGIIDFIAGFDIGELALSILSWVSAVFSAVVEGISALLLDLVDLLINPNTWRLVGAWLQDLPARMKNAGIKIINALAEPILKGINDIIDKYNNSFLATILGKIEPISFELLPEIPPEEVNKHYNEVKRQIEEENKKDKPNIDATLSVTATTKTSPITLAGVFAFSKAVEIADKAAKMRMLIQAEYDKYVNPADAFSDGKSGGSKGITYGGGGANMVLNVLPSLGDRSNLTKDMNTYVVKKDNPWKALVNPVYNTRKFFQEKMTEYVTRSSNPWKALVNPAYNTGKQFNADMRKYITDKIAKKLVNPTYGSGKQFNADLRTYVTDKIASKKVNPVYGSGKGFNADLRTYVTDKVAAKKVNPYYNSDKDFFDKFSKKITGVTNITKVNPALSVTSTYTKALNDVTKDKTLTVTAKLSIDSTATRNAISSAMSGASTKVSLSLSGSEIVSGTMRTHLAKGGLAYGLTSAIIGEYAGARNNPEVVAPLNKLQGILERSNMGGNKDTMTREQANTMIGLLKELTKKETVVRPSVELGQVVDRSLKAYART